MDTFNSVPSCWWDDISEQPWGPPLSLPSEVDIAVVGGGWMGVSTAYWLARAGAQVLLLEKHQLAWGASGRNAGLMLAGASPLEDPKLLNSVLEEEHIEAECTHPGHLALACTPEIWDRIRCEAAERATSQLPVHALDPGGCEDLLQMRVNGRFLGGRWLPSGGTAHPVRLVNGLAAGAQRRGAFVAVETTVREINATRGHSRLVILTSRGPVRAGHVVLACQHQVGNLWPDYQRMVSCIRGQVLSTTPMPRKFALGMAVDWGTVYWRQTHEGVIVLGGLRNLDQTAESSAEACVNDRIQDALAHFLPDAFPDFPPICVAWRWAGIMDYSQDGRPLIGRIPQTSNWWVIAGFGGHGLPAGLGAGKALAEAITTGQMPSVLEPYSPARFE